MLLCILFFPVGLYLLWTKDSFSKNGKLVITAILAILVINAVIDGDGEKKQKNDTFHLIHKALNLKKVIRITLKKKLKKIMKVMQREIKYMTSLVQNSHIAL